MIVDDWSSERRFSMPPALRVLGVRSSLAVPIAGKERPFGVLDIHSTEPTRFTPQDVHFAQASANVLADALERHSADEALRPRVLPDSLTGLPNRLSFVDSLRDALSRSLASGSPVGILFLDLDRFKQVNDTYGHQAGDRVLQELADILRETAREIDQLGRYGGEEFLAILPDSDPEAAVTFAERVRETVEGQKFDIRTDAPLDMTISAGVATYPHDDPDGPRRLVAERRAGRDEAAVRSALDAMVEVARGSGNLIPPMLDAARAEATLGEICDALRDEWGIYMEPARF